LFGGAWLDFCANQSKMAEAWKRAEKRINNRPQGGT